MKTQNNFLQALPRIILDDVMVRKIIKDIKSNEPSGAYFDAAHMAVRYFIDLITNNLH